MHRPAWWCTVRRRVGRRGSALMFFGCLDLVYAFGLIWPDEVAMATPTMVWFSSVMPLEAWGMLWAAAGVVCLYHAFHRNDTFGFRVAIGIKMLWGGISLLGWVFADVPRGYVNTAIWYGLAGLVWIIAGWREPSPYAEDDA